jgi:hypothetical protein
VLPNALIEPIGPTPAYAALVIKGRSEQVLSAHSVRLVSRIAQRIAPVLGRAILRT